MYQINRQQKILVKIYLCLFVVLFVAMNWNTISWVFNYRVVSGMVDEFFSPYPESALLASAQGVGKPLAVAATPTQESYPYSEKPNSIEIPMINIEAPIVIGQTTDIKLLTKDLDQGVVYYPGSVLPGENGHIIILGHSAPLNWPKIKYDWVFSKINELKTGDEIVVHFNNTKYVYRITEKMIVKPGEEVTPKGLNNENNILTIVSCWPPGKLYQRITVQAELLPPPNTTVSTQMDLTK